MSFCGAIGVRDPKFWSFLKTKKRGVSPGEVKRRWGCGNQITAGG
jgi:hypothetical protein